MEQEHATTSAAPPVSIGLPVFNGQQYLRETLDSLLAQTCGDFELIISDNASTDATEEICRGYASRDRRVLYHRQDRNRGAAHNYNLAVELARGRFFKWNADDDLIDPDVLLRCLALLEERPEVVLCYPQTRIIDAASRVVREYDDRIAAGAARASDRFLRVLSLTGECNAVFGLIRREVLRRTARIARYIGSDVVLLGELSLYGGFHQLAGSCFYRRDHPAASSSDKRYRRQIEFYDPGSRRRFLMTNWRHHCEFLRAILRAPLPPAEKARCTAHVARHLFHVRRALARDVAVAARCLFKRGRRHEAL